MFTMLAVLGIDKGLELAADELFREESGARSDVPKFLVVFSDGDFTSYHSVSTSLQRLPIAC